MSEAFPEAEKYTEILGIPIGPKTVRYKIWETASFAGLVVQSPLENAYYKIRSFPETCRELGAFVLDGLWEIWRTDQSPERIEQVVQDSPPVIPATELESSNQSGHLG